MEEIVFGPIREEEQQKELERDIERHVLSRIRSMEGTLVELLEQSPAEIFATVTVSIRTSSGGVPSVESVDVVLGTSKGPESESTQGFLGEISVYTYSFKLLDVEQERQRQEREREQRELSERLHRAAAAREKGKKAAAPSPPARAESPPSLAPKQEGAPSFSPLPGMEMYEARTQAAAFVERAQSWADQLTKMAHGILAGTSSDKERTRFLSQEAQWRDAVRYRRNWHADNGPGWAREKLDRLLGVEGQELESLRLKIE